MTAPPGSLPNLVRQFGYALESSASTNDALAKLREAVAAEQAPLVDALEALLQAPATRTESRLPQRLASADTLAWLLQCCPDPARAIGPVFAEYQRHESFRTTELRSAWGEFSSALAYLGAILAVLLVVVTFYGVIVLPSLEALYDGFHSTLPAVTRWVFSPGVSGFLLVWLLVVLALGFAAWFIFRLRLALRRFAPLPPFYRRAPLLGAVARAYDTYLRLAYAGALRAAGLDAAAAIEAGASRRADAASTAMLKTEDFAAAQKLGRLDSELEYQRTVVVDAFLEALVRARRRTRAAFTFIVFSLVALYVTGMYEPIFSLGSAI